MSADATIEPVIEVAPGRTAAGRLAIVVGSYLAIVIAAAIYPLVSPLRDFWNAPVTAADQAVNALTALLWLAVLVVSYRRQPTGRMWKLIFLVIALQRIAQLAYVPDSFVWSLARALEQVGIAVLIHLLVAFPSGYLRDRFDRAIVGLAYALVGIWTAVQVLLAGDWWQLACDPVCIHNVLVVWPNEALYNSLRNVLAAAFAVTVVPGVAVAVLRHWRSAGPAARRALLPLVVAVPLWIGIGTIDFVSRELDVTTVVDFFDGPSGTVILWITPMILPAGLLLGTVRSRWSRGRIANLVVELGRGVPVGGLRDVLARALDDPTLQLAFVAPTGAGFVDANGQPIELPVDDPTRAITRLERGGDVLGILIHDPAIDAEDPGLVEAVGNAARLALENERLAAEVRAQLEEVRASRSRIVEAADAERRRVERDLHDGAQQRLVALAMRLQVAKTSSPEATELLDEATVELQTAIGEVRGLARGIHPTILTEAGLAAAVDALAERTPVPVSVAIADRRYDAHVEATAYFVVAEALTNVARYASASEAHVSVAEEARRLVVTVTDDGRGGADPAAGSGLRGLEDRLAAVDGTLTVESPAGGGTTIRAELPLDRSLGSAMAEADFAEAPSGLSRVRAVPGSRPEPVAGSRIRLSNPLLVTAVVGGSIALIAAVAALPSLSPGSPVSGRADSFVRPFDYQVPADSNIQLYPKSDRLHVLSAPPGDHEGISIWSVGEVLADNCDWHPDSNLAPRKPGVDGLLSYIRSVGRVNVRDIGAVALDGRPAFKVEVTVASGSTGCPAPVTGPPITSLFLWRDTSPAGEGIVMQVPKDGRVPLTIVDVDGETIAIEVWRGGPIDEWIPTADRIIESIRFIYRPPPSGVLPGRPSTP